MRESNARAFLPAGEDDGYPQPPTGRQRVRKMVLRASRRVLGVAIYAVVSIWGGLRSVRRVGQHPLPLCSPAFHPTRILIIRLDLIGDLVLSMVLVRVLRRTYPQAELDLISVPASARVIEGDPDVTLLPGYDPNVWRRPQALLRRENWRELQTLLRQLRGREYDLAISVFGRWASILAALSGARRTLGFRRESFAGLLTDGVAGGHWAPAERKHEVDYCLELARAAGGIVQATDRWSCLYVQQQSLQEIEHILQAHGVQPGPPLIACHVSATNGQSKRWPVPYWALLLDRLVREEGAVVVLSGAPADRPLVEKITARMCEQAVNLVGQTSLTQLAALLKRADLLISGDSGPMHMAGAVGTPLVAIHGPTDPALSGPLSQQAVILRSDIWCSPCYQARDTADCRFFTTQCMKDIGPAQVLAAVRGQLQARARH
jgi:lipopolysaccharide heptosyltransferase II